MKKLMKLFVLVAAAAMALASCQKNEITGPETQEVHFTIKADIAETKTFITDKGDKTYTPSWSKGDKIGVLFALEENAKAVDFENTAEAGEEATFEGKHAFTVVEGASEVDGYLYAFYPSSAFNKFYSDGGVRLDLKVTQYPTSTSFDPSCDLLIAKPCYYMAEATGEDAEVVIDDMYFARMMSVLRINLNSEFLSNETVKSVSFDADGVDFTGAMKFNLATGEFVGNQSTSQDLSEVKAVYSEEDPIYVAGEKNSAYLVLAPVTIPSGTTLTFTIETENYDIVKTITAPADMVMPAGNVAVINLTIEEENCEAIISDTRIWVEGFDGETTNKKQTTPNESGVAGTGVSEELKYAYSNDNCNVRINNNGQTSTNPFLYINTVDASFTVSNIQITNEENLALSAMIKGSGLKLTVEYKESTSSTWSKAGIITGTNSYAIGRVVFAAPENATSLDIRLTGNGVIYVDDIVLEATEEAVPVVTLTSISLSNKKTEYLVGEDFTKPTVTAIYSDDTTTDVTEFATFSECDMNTAGEKTVIVTYEEKTAEYIFIVKEQGAAPDVSGWVATSFSNLKAGDQVVIVSTKGSSIYAMPNNNGASSAPGVVAVTYSNNKLTSEPESKIVWYVGVDGDNRIFYADKADGTEWLYCNDSNNGVRVGTNANKTFTLDSSGYLKHIATSRFLGVYNNQDWRCYTNTTGNTAGQSFQFFVKSGESGGSTGGGTTDPETPGEGGGNEGGETPTPDPDPTPDQPGEAGTSTISVTFADYTAGTQYATNEEHKINNVLTLYTTQCHFTSELRIYSSSAHNGYVISNKLPGAITNLSFNAGNNTDTLNVYGSTDGITWTLVNGVNITSSYKDYSVDFTGSYTYFKMDVAGANQLRLKSLSVTYKN